MSWSLWRSLAVLPFVVVAISLVAGMWQTAGACGPPPFGC